MIESLVQTTLDTALTGKNIYVHEKRKSGPDAEEYIVFRRGPTNTSEFADDTGLVAHDTVTVKYYYKDTMLETHAGRTKVHQNEATIKTALEAAGFILPSGYFDAGDVDDIGFMVTVFECEYWMVI